MKMRSPMIAVLIINLCASSSGVLASDTGSYKPSFAADEPVKPAWRKVAKKNRPQAGIHQFYRVPRAPRVVDCSSIVRSFETVDLRDEAYRENTFDPAIGCSLRSNLGAMVQNRRDLVRGRGTPYSDGERAANIVSEYRAWKSRSNVSSEQSSTQEE